MDTRINTKHSPNFGKLIVLKSAEKPFNQFKQINNKGLQEHKDVFEKYFKIMEKSQNENPIDIVIDYLKLGKNKTKKLVATLTNGRTKITIPQKLKSGTDKKRYIQYYGNNKEIYVDKTPNYIKQLQDLENLANASKDIFPKDKQKNVAGITLFDF